MRKTSLLIALFVLIVPVVAFGQSMVSSFTAPKQISRIPADIRGDFPESDWVELYCYEAKAKGGEAVARIEALAELLPPLFSIAEEFGVKAILTDLAAKAASLEGKLDAICTQNTAEDAQNKVNAFVDEAETFRSRVGNEIRAQIEPELKAKGEALKAKLTVQLQAEGERLGAEAKANLQAQAKTEAAATKARIKATMTQQIEAELAHMADRGEFGEEPDEAALRAKGQQLLDAKIGEVEVEEKAKLQAKMEQLAEKERARIAKVMDEKADEISGDEKVKLEAIRDGFEGLGAKLDELTETKMARWDEYKAKAVAKRKEILVATVEKQFAEAKEMIMSMKPQIDEAVAVGNTNVPPLEELIADLEADKDKFINSLSNSALDDSEIRVTASKFQKEWNNVRSRLEWRAKMGASAIYNRIKLELERKGYGLEVIAALDPATSEFGRGPQAYENWRQWCLVARSDTARYTNPDWANWSEYYLENYCYPYRGMNLYDFPLKTRGELVGMDEWLVRGAEVEARTFAKLKEFLSLSTNSELETMFSYKKELFEAVAEYQAVVAEHPQGKYLLKNLEVVTYGL